MMASMPPEKWREAHDAIFHEIERFKHEAVEDAELEKARRQVERDMYRELDWSDQPLKILDDLEGRDSYILEGIQVPRVLRKGLIPEVVLVLREPFEPLTGRQRGLGKAIDKWLGDWQEMPHAADVTYLDLKDKKEG